MNHKFLSGFTATLLIATLGVLPSYADQAGTVDDGSAAKVSAESGSLNQEISTQIEPAAKVSQPAQPAEVASAPLPTTSSQEVVKVGEYQSQDADRSEAPIAIIHPHELAGRQAATVYVHNIPVVTFLASSVASTSSSRTPSSDGSSGNATAENFNPSKSSPSNSDIKVASIQDNSLGNLANSRQAFHPIRQQATESKSQDTATQPADPNDPVWRATEAAARLNQLHRDSVDASTITVSWDEQHQGYVIKAGEDELVEMDANAILPNTTENPSEDALQATNLIRRQLGNAPPLQSIAGDRRSQATVSLGPVQFSITGMASWYGPGFDGNYSASGEVFNQNALTAAHRNLPFGTQVRVTNMDNGMSVVVRINDRGPYADDRIIDLSRGAASAIGLVQSGVAPVNLEVLGAATSASR
ncbi:MAG TPA: septal ring lytic transglycosylase RlpA family protein [Coleofasciculaceae cyanobacterium]